MNNKQNNVSRNALDTQRQQSNSAYSGFMPGLGTDLNNARTNSSGLRQELLNKYSDQNFLPSGMKPNANGWFDLPAAQGGDYSKASGVYSNFAENGGVNRDDFNPALESYKGFMKTGGVDSTGIRRAADVILPSFYEAYKRNAQNRASIQGGFNPGFDEQMAEIGRQQGREGFNAKRQSEGDIARLEQQGRMFGTSGYGDLMSGITGMEQSGKLAGARGLESVAGAADAAGARSQSLQLALAQMYQNAKQDQASGLKDVYGQDRADSNSAISQWLAAQSGRSGNDLSNLGIRSNIRDRSIWDVVPGLVGAAGGIASGFAGMPSGIAPMRGKGQYNPYAFNYTPPMV